jgi:hypothetical protein
MEIVQIIPRLPGRVDGLADYSLLLAKELRHAHNISTRFLSGSPGAVGTQVDDFMAVAVSERTAHALLQSLGAETSRVLLHYVGYGYAPRGCPFWLVEGLERWRGNPGNRLITVFHELYAFGAPWHSSFWLNPIQKALAKRLAKISDHRHTTLQRYRTRLEQFCPQPSRETTALPVFSTIGEQTTLASLAERTPQMVIFGGEALRGETYNRHQEELSKACEALEINRIVDIGPPISAQPRPAIPLHSMGQLPPQEVTRILAESRAGFVTYFDGYLAKSSIFAAYAAHGVVPVLPAPNHSEEDGLYSGQQYLAANDLSEGAEEEFVESIRRGAMRWYGTHSIGLTSAKLAAVLNGLGSG